MIHKIAAPAYQGRSSWPTFNVEFADRMLEYDEHSGTDKYRSCAAGYFGDIRTATETHGGYQELLSEKGLKYRTWAYQGAVAHSWFPRFLSVWRRAFGTPLLSGNESVAALRHCSPEPTSSAQNRRRKSRFAQLMSRCPSGKRRGEA